MDNELTSDATSRDLANLFLLGKREGSQDSELIELTAGSVLHEMLESPLSADAAFSGSVPAVLGRPCEELQPHEGRVLVDVLLDKAVELAVTKTLKDYARKLGHAGMPETTERATKTIYYAAIASALVFHQTKITQLSYEALDQGFALFEAKPWVIPEFKELFSRARDICQTVLAGTETDEPG